MTDAQLQTALSAIAEHGIAGLLIAAILIGFIAWLKWGRSGNGNGNGAHKRIDKVGDVAVDNAKENAALTARFEAMEKQNEKEHTALEAMIVKLAERVGAVEDKLDKVLELLNAREDITKKP